MAASWWCGYVRCRQQKPRDRSGKFRMVDDIAWDECGTFWRRSGLPANATLAMAIIAIYLAAEPQRYRSGLLRLLPTPMHRRASELFDAIADILRRWLSGQLAVMATVGVLSGLGLSALGIKAAFVLGL